MIRLTHHGDCNITVHSEEIHITKVAKKPKARVLYFDYSILFNETNHESKLSYKRLPMKLPVYWEDAPYEMYPTKRTIAEWSWLKEKQDHLQNSVYYDKPNHNPLRPYNESIECIPMHEWQGQSLPTCNLVHEAVDLTQLLVSTNDYGLNYKIKIEHKRLLSSGYFRDTYVFTDEGALTTASTNPIALKTLRLRRSYNAWILDRHRMDALVLDRMKKSEWIIDIYGYCGAAGLFEYGTGDMSNWHNMDSEDDNDKKFLQRLKYAYQVANAISDLHTIASYEDGRFSAVVHGKSGF